MSPLAKPRAILFDWDNTLVNTWPLIHAALNLTLRHMDHPEWSYNRVRNEVKKSMRDSFPEMFGDRWKEAADFYQHSYRALHLKQLEALPGAADMLATIPQERVFVGIVSNKMGSTLRKEVAHLGWEHFVQATVGAGDATRDKPHADPVILALRDSGIAPGPDVWFVGDTGIDLECASITGCIPILYGECITDGRTHEGFPFAAHVVNHADLKCLIGSNS